MAMALSMMWISHFNSHAHVERDVQLNTRWKRQLHFNSHAHVERDVAEGASSDTQKISTHTLTWSVTRILDPQLSIPKISTHTLTWSVTSLVLHRPPP